MGSDKGTKSAHASGTCYCRSAGLKELSCSLGYIVQLLLAASNVRAPIRTRNFEAKLPVTMTMHSVKSGSISSLNTHTIRMPICSCQFSEFTLLEYTVPILIAQHEAPFQFIYRNNFIAPSSQTSAYILVNPWQSKRKNIQRKLDTNLMPAALCRHPPPRSILRPRRRRCGVAA